MKIIDNILTTSPCYKAGRKISPKGLMIHSVGCPQPNAIVFVNTWKTSTQACAHAVMGRDGNAYQVLPWNHRGWHAGSPANEMFISIELTEPSTIRYTSGSNFVDNNPSNSKAHVLEVYKHAVQFAAFICKQYGFNPLDSNQLLSHSEGNKKGWATNHGDVEHMWKIYGLSMNQFRKDVNAALGGVVNPPASGKTKIAGTADGTVDEMRAYIKSVNSNVPQSVLDMIPYYISEGKTEGIRGDIAFAQSCLETGNFTFAGSAVTLDQNNFCGLGVTSNGMKGSMFNTPQLGIRAQIQHLKAYANKEPLVNACIDPRFSYVQRGCAEYVEYLGIQENPSHLGWAAGAGYGSKIMSILNKIVGSTPGNNNSDNGYPVTGVKVKVTTDVLNIRSGPGAGYSKVGEITDKGTYTVISISGNWGKLKSGLGWICLDYTDYKEDSTPNTGLPCVVRVTADSLTIRSGPGVNYSVAGSITDKGAYTIVEISENWGKLKSGAGWICLDYTTYQGSSRPNPSPNVPFAVRVTADSLNIRSGPGVNYPVAGSITDKGTYTIIEISGEWGKLKSGAGWICLDYTDYQGNPGPGTTPNVPYVVKVTADSLTIRSGPGVNYSAAGSITDKGSYTIIEVSGNWGKLKSGAGWICLDYTTRA